ncbi:S-layer homology domain-containing protein [Paenibacillus sacheonensis]|uniref:SLH domain-containing protein n=1 Tax=Paenibacillus sacheonensis TaxID=742054 RepID=A0A7X5BZT4_9BACL|nr:S-layer homology domain-containing protein [Paenibacillus sacheonensis]MBM7563942.1 hypothetical protein [Paenibacillus sacheonensis]NBC67714.1 hypothetical protein [Paenibacillus sacheonensis]
MLRKLSSIVVSAGLLLGASGLGIMPAGRALAAENPVQTQEVLLNGFENSAAWTGNDGGVARVADTQDKTQGTQSIGVTFPVPADKDAHDEIIAAWREFSWETSASTIDLSDATELKVDIKPVGGTAPLHFKLINANDEGIYESGISIPNADAWNTFELDLGSIPAAKRAEVKKVIFYVYNKDGEIDGRTSLNFKFDNMRAVKTIDTTIPLSEKLLNGFDNTADWPVNHGEMAAAADKADKTQGQQSYNVTFPVPNPGGDAVWEEIHWNTTSLPVDLSSAETLKFDLKPLGDPATGNPTTGDMEPLRFKLVNDETPIYEDAIPTHTLSNGSNPWTVTEGADGWRTYALDLTKLPGDRSEITYFVFYVYNKDSGSIQGRTSVQYEFDNLRVMTHEVQGVTASPDSSAVTAGSAVTLTTTTAGASIFYTTDGTDPRTSGTKQTYTGPITVNDATLIKAYAEVAGSKSAVSTYQYTLGTGTPGEELFGLKNNVADTLDRMVAGLKKADNVDQNGYVADWSGQTGFKLPSDGKQVKKLVAWNGTDDLSADVSLAYDADNLYVHAKVKDDTQFDKSGGDIWIGDSIQMAFSADGYAYGPEYGFSYNGGSLSKFRWSSGSAKLDVDSVKLKASRDESAKETTYDIVMPWLAALPAAPTGNVAFTMLVNDNDGTGRESFIEWTPGIGVTPKDATSMGSLSLLDAITTWAAALHGTNAGVTNTPYNYVLTLSNFGTDAADFAVSMPDADLDTHVSVPAGKVVKKTIRVTFENTGSRSVSATVTVGGAARTESIDVSVQQNGDELSAALDALNAKLPALEDLFAQAKEQGIPADYETVNLEVIKQFIAYGKDDIAHDYITRANYVAEELQKLYAEAETNLKAYLDGSKQAMSVPEYVSSRSAISGTSLVADTKTSVSDAIAQRPVFFTGYGHFSQAQNDIPIFNNLGANIIQMEIGPRSTVMAPNGEDEDYSISTDAITNSVLPVLQNAQANNVAVSLLLSPHYFPDWAFAKWPDLKNGNAGFLNYNINDPRARAVVEAFLRAIVPMVKDCKSLQSFVISNEPNYDTRKDSYAVGPWHEFLQAKYGVIGALNELYGTDYASFGDVAMPAGKQAALPNYDWTVFNNKYFSEWHAWMAGIIHELAPDIPVSAKTMARMDDAVSFGINQEDFSKFTTLNGNDNWNFSSDVSSYMDENKYYDLQNAMHAAPVFNSETHIIADRDTDYSPQKAKHAETSLFQSAVHGKSASTIWVWERSYDKNSDFYGSVLERPDVVKAIGKVGLDLNRLSYEVTELQNIKPQAAILYSLPSLVYSSAYNTTLSDAYSALTLSGQKAGFVSEQQATDGGLSAYKLLIVPQATNVSAPTLTAIKAFVAGGGKVIVVGSGSLDKDENNQPLNADDRDAVMAGSQVLADSSALKSTVRAALSNLGLMNVVLKDKETGAIVDGVEWQSTVYDGKLLLNIADYDPAAASKTIGIEVNGQPAGTAQELINGGAVDTSNFTIEQEKPYLLSFGGDSGSGGGPVIIPDQPNVVKDEVVTVSPKLANGMASGAVTADELTKAWNGSEKGSDGKKTAVVDLQAVNGADGYALQLPAALFGGADSADRQVAVRTSQGTFLLPLGMFDAKDLEGVGTLELTIRKADSSELGDSVKQAVEIGFQADGKALRWNNADAPATITVPYTPSEEELSHADHLTIWYIDEAGNHVPVPSGHYDEQAGAMVFQATHFSKYAVAYVTTAYTDIQTLAWAKSAIEAVTAKGIMSGTSASLFSPGASISRAAFTDALVKALGLSARFETNFADVPAASPYYESIGVARKLGIANGSGRDAFNPNAPITRQEMAALVVRGLQASGRTVEVGTEADLKAFADAKQIAAYAIRNMAALVKEGILKGDGKNLLPKGQVTRAQTAVLMDRLYNAR